MSDHVGDAEGKRIALRRIDHAKEAVRMAECLSILLRRAGLPDDEVKSLAQKLRGQVTHLEQKSCGRINSRRNNKSAAAPLLEKRPINLLFIDESGQASLKSNEDFFSIGAVSMKEADVNGYVQNADEIKRRFFGTTNITFHEPLMRNHDREYYFNGNRTKQLEFDAAIRNLVLITPFVAFGSGIRKRGFETDFVATGCDPYLPTSPYALAITLVLERYVDFLSCAHHRQLGRVNLESIGPKEDANHQAAYVDLLIHGTQWVTDSSFRGWLETGCRFSPKMGSNPAELADLVAREVFEFTRSQGQAIPPYWDILQNKFYLRDDGLAGRFGLKVFPDSDIRDAILAHRAKCGAGTN